MVELRQIATRKIDESVHVVQQLDVEQEDLALPSSSVGINFYQIIEDALEVLAVPTVVVLVAVQDIFPLVHDPSPESLQISQKLQDNGIFFFQGFLEVSLSLFDFLFQ